MEESTMCKICDGLIPLNKDGSRNWKRKYCSEECGKRAASVRASAWTREHRDKKPDFFTECQDCSGSIDREYAGKGPRPSICETCEQLRKRARWHKWRANPGSGEKLAEYQRQKREADPDYPYAFLIKSRYHFTLDQYYEMLEKQNGGCAICTSPTVNVGNQKHFQIDHDHSCCAGNKSCGKCIRGLLCGVCNKMLGAVNDNTTVLENAIRYLQEWKIDEPNL